MDGKPREERNPVESLKNFIGQRGKEPRGEPAERPNEKTLWCTGERYTTT